MKVALYAGRTPPEGGGGFTFEESVLGALLALSEESRHQFVVVGSGPLLDLARDSGADVLPLPSTGIKRAVLRVPRPFVAASRRQRRLVSYTGSDAVVTSSEADFLMCLGPEVPSTSIPYSMVIWDLQHRLLPFFPEVSTEGRWERREAYFSKVLPRAAIVVVGTQAGRHEVERFYQVPHERIVILPHPTPSFALEAAESGHEGRPPAGFPTDEPFVFYPAQFWPHKNHATLIEALRIIHDRGGPTCKLVLVGSDWGGNRDHVHALATGLVQDVVFLNFVERHELVWLYRNALALVYPSLFGPENLPPLEAFALGCPVIATRVPGAEEQLGDAALLGDGIDATFFADAITGVLKDNEARRELIERGHQRASRSTPQSFASGLIAELDRFEPIRRNWASPSRDESR